MVPSTKLTVEDVLRILRARIGLLLVTLAMVSATTAAATLLLPNRYRSETMILVQPQRLPDSYVRSTVTARIEDRLQSITQQILSRTRLEGIIAAFDLYAAKRHSVAMETVVEEMRKDIDVKVVKGSAFRVAFVGDDARTVMEVTNRLAALFIEENLHDREVLAEDTNQFLGAQVADARRRLIEQEKTLEAYRNRFSGQLPSQLTANVQAIQNVQVQLQMLRESVNRDRDRRLLIERQLRDLEREIQVERVAPVARAAVADGAQVPTAGLTTAQQLAAARADLAALELRLKSDHPDLWRSRRTVRDLESKTEAEALKAPVSSAASAVPAEMERRARIADLRAQLEQLDRQVVSKEAEDKRLRSVADGYQRRVDAVPARESELAELTRDYSTLQTLYQTLLAKQEESKIAANLERRQIGDQFKLLDPARVSERPFSPRRWLIDLAGIAAGLFVGLGLVVALEYRDQTFTTDDEVRTELALPVLAVVPLIESDDELRRSSRQQRVRAVATGLVVAACVPVVVYSLLI